MFVALLPDNWTRSASETLLFRHIRIESFRTVVGYSRFADYRQAFQKRSSAGRGDCDYEA
jgi:hypothetical protein